MGWEILIIAAAGVLVAYLYGRKHQRWTNRLKAAPVAEVIMSANDSGVSGRETGVTAASTRNH